MNNSDTDDQLYDVEKITGYRYAKGAHEFHVKWAGYDGMDSWEPVKNLSCPNLISEYFLRQNAEKRCQDESVQTDSTNEVESDSFIQIFKKGRQKEIIQPQKNFDTILDIPCKIESIDIKTKEAKLYYSSDTTNPVIVSVDWLTNNFPSLVNQYFLDQLKNKNHV